MTTRILALPFRAWMTAIRLPTLLIPSIQIFVGTALAYVTLGKINPLIALYAWIAAVAITIGTNLINDALDFDKGADRHKSVSNRKMISSGILTQKEVYIGGVIAFVIACMVPIALDIDSWYCLGFVLISVLCGYCYTGGPYPISYLGLSEVFIFLFYGGVGVIVPFYAQTYTLSPQIILAAIELGLLAILPNALNNYRDIYEDAKVHKKTLAVRFGIDFCKREIQFLTLAPFILNLGWFFLGYAEAALMPLLLVPIAVIYLKGINATHPTNQLGNYFKLSLMIHFSFGALLMIGLFIG